MFSKNFVCGFIYYALENSTAFHHSLSMHIGITEKGFAHCFFPPAKQLFMPLFTRSALLLWKPDGRETSKFPVASHDPQSLFRIPTGAPASAEGRRQKLKLEISKIPHPHPNIYRTATGITQHAVFEWSLTLWFNGIVIVDYFTYLTRYNNTMVKRCTAFHLFVCS